LPSHNLSGQSFFLFPHAAIPSMCFSSSLNSRSTLCIQFLDNFVYPYSTIRSLQLLLHVLNTLPHHLNFPVILCHVYLQFRVIFYLWCSSIILTRPSYLLSPYEVLVSFS
jgi:hypothetical protein